MREYELAYTKYTILRRAIFQGLCKKDRLGEYKQSKKYNAKELEHILNSMEAKNMKELEKLHKEFLGYKLNEKLGHTLYTE